MNGAQRRKELSKTDPCDELDAFPRGVCARGGGRPRRFRHRRCDSPTHRSFPAQQKVSVAIWEA